MLFLLSNSDPKNTVKDDEFFDELYSDFKIDRTLMDDLLETLEIGSLCALGGGLPLPIKNALKYFDTELEPYFTK